MKKINDLRIKTKILLIVVVNACFLLAIGICAFVGLSNGNQAKEDILVNANAIYSQMTADMMHDALRADVYNAMLTDRRDSAQVQAVRKDLAEHTALFQQSLDNLEKLKLAQTIQEAVANAKKPLEDYLRISEEIVVATLANDSTMNAQATAQLQTYQETFAALADKMQKLSDLINADSEERRTEASRIHSVSKDTVGAITLLAILVATWVGIKIASTLVLPILSVKETIQNLSSGMFPDTKPTARKDEIGDMANSLHDLVANLANVRDFSLEVGAGRFGTSISFFNNQGQLSESLYAMRDNLKYAAEQDNQRSWWSTEGLSQLADVLRKTNDNAEKLFQEVNLFLVKYLKANQGGLFVAEQEGSETRLRMAACYAYDRKKYLQKQVLPGEGLIGQCLQEGESIYLTDIPADYISISSGLGEASPNCLAIVPLKSDGCVQGVIEIASFRSFTPHEMEFLNKAAENLASAIARVKISERTHALLADSQQQTEEMRAQEEEMRQNMEELTATQEEMNRKEREYLHLIEELNLKLHATEQNRVWASEAENL